MMDIGFLAICVASACIAYTSGKVVGPIWGGGVAFTAAFAVILPMLAFYFMLEKKDGR